VVGRFDGHHVGYGVTASKTKSTSALAASLVPGAAPTEWAGVGVVAGCLIAFFSLVGIFTGGLDLAPRVLSLFFGLAVAILSYRAVGGASPEREAWEYRCALFERGWVCVRCGHTWLPGQQTEQEQIYKPRNIE
jgi:hypothetical protein